MERRHMRCRCSGRRAMQMMVWRWRGRWGSAGADDDFAGGVARHAAIPRSAGLAQGEARIHHGLHVAAPHELHHGVQIVQVVAHVEILIRVLRPAHQRQHSVAHGRRDARQAGRQVHHFGPGLQLRGECGQRDEVRAVEDDVVFSSRRTRVLCAFWGSVVQHLVRFQAPHELHVALPACDRRVRARQLQQLQEEDAHATRCAGDQHVEALAASCEAPDARLPRALQGCVPRHHRTRAFCGGDLRGPRHCPRRQCDCVLRECPALLLTPFLAAYQNMEVRDDLVAGVESRDAGSQSDDLGGNVCAGDEGEVAWEEVLGEPVLDAPVHRVDATGLHLHQQLALPGFRNRHLHIEMNCGMEGLRQQLISTSRACLPPWYLEYCTCRMVAATSSILSYTHQHSKQLVAKDGQACRSDADKANCCLHKSLYSREWRSLVGLCCNITELHTCYSYVISVDVRIGVKREKWA